MKNIRKIWRLQLPRPYGTPWDSYFMSIPYQEPDKLLGGKKKRQNSGINIINVTCMLPFIVPKSFTNWWTFATLAWIFTRNPSISPTFDSSFAMRVMLVLEKRSRRLGRFKVCCVTIERSVALVFFDFFPKVISHSHGKLYPVCKRFTYHTFEWTPARLGVALDSRGCIDFSYWDGAFPGQVPVLLICRFVMFVLAWCFDLLPAGDNKSQPAESGIFWIWCVSMTCEGASWLEQPLGSIRDQPWPWSRPGTGECSWSWRVAHLYPAQSRRPVSNANDAWCREDRENHNQ